MHSNILLTKFPRKDSSCLFVCLFLQPVVKLHNSKAFLIPSSLHELPHIIGKSFEAGLQSSFLIAREYMHIRVLPQ
jgi:hypothetical protein